MKKHGSWVGNHKRSIKELDTLREHTADIEIPKEFLFKDYRLCNVKRKDRFKK